MSGDNAIEARAPARRSARATPRAAAPARPAASHAHHRPKLEHVLVLFDFEGVSIGAVDGWVNRTRENQGPVDGSGDSGPGAARKASRRKEIGQAGDAGHERAQPLDNPRQAARSAAELDSRPVAALEQSWGCTGLHGLPGADSGRPGPSRCRRARRFGSGCENPGRPGRRAAPGGTPISLRRAVRDSHSFPSC